MFTLLLDLSQLFDLGSKSGSFLLFVLPIFDGEADLASGVFDSQARLLLLCLHLLHVLLSFAILL